MYQKYLKYKKKYLELKEMVGGLSQYVKLDNHTNSFLYAIKTNKNYYSTSSNIKNKNPHLLIKKQ